MKIRFLRKKLFKVDWELQSVYSPSQPDCRALFSHKEVIFLSLINKASALSLADSQISVAALHFSASFWYWDATLLASARVTFIWRLCSSATASCSFSSSVRRSTNCFSISCLSSGSSLPQSVHNTSQNSFSGIQQQRRNILTREYKKETICGKGKIKCSSLITDKIPIRVIVTKWQACSAMKLLSGLKMAIDSWNDL